MFTATRNISSKINQGTPKITTVLLNQEMAKYKALPEKPSGPLLGLIVMSH
jgi:hypothetical protein